MKNLILTAALVLAGTPATAAPWVSGYVVEKYEPAFHYGGRSGTTDPGPDCPKGTIGDNDYRALLSTRWRTEAEIAPLLLKPAEDKNPNATHFALETAISYRGWRRDIETYINPFGAPDPGMQEVTGRIAEGFDLDGNPKTGGFTGPAGERGVDNALFRSWGCIMSYRGVPYSAYLGTRGTDKMQEGLFTMVIRMSGNKDPMNDDDVTFEVGFSPDKMVKGGSGHVSPDYSFRMLTGAEYTRLKARIKNGVVETEQVPQLRVPDFAWFQANSGEALYYNGRMRLTIGPDGNVDGLIGGYRDWRDVFANDTWNQGQPEPNSATTREVFYHENQIGMYYALKRNADARPDPRTGRNTAISIAYRFTAVPAFVLDPKTPMTIQIPEGERERVQMAETLRATFRKAISTLTFQKNPYPARPRGRRSQPKVAEGAEPATNAQTAQPSVATVERPAQ